MNGLRGHPTSMILTSERASRQKVTLRERQSKELCQRVKYLHTGASLVSTSIQMKAFTTSGCTKYFSCVSAS